MKEGHLQWSEFMVQLPWSNFLKIGFESLGPLIRCKPNVNQEEWPIHQKWMCWFFLMHAQNGSFEISSRLTILLSSLGLQFLLNVSKMCLQIFSQQFLQKRNDQFNLYMFNVIYMWYVPCVVITLNRMFSVCWNLMLLPPYFAQH